MSSPRRRLVMLLGLSACGACVSLGGTDTPSHTWYRLRDLRPAQPEAGPPIARSLLIEYQAPAQIYDASALVYSRRAGVLAPYQFAQWAERPARQVGQLVERRLQARGRLASVAQSTAAVRGELLLRLTLDSIVHDLSATPGQASVELIAELVDWRARSLRARRAFAVRESLASDDAAAAVQGFDRAITRLLDEIAPWVEGLTAQG